MVRYPLLSTGSTQDDRNRPDISKQFDWDKLTNNAEQKTSNLTYNDNKSNPRMTSLELSQLLRFM